MLRRLLPVLFVLLLVCAGAQAESVIKLTLSTKAPEPTQTPQPTEAISVPSLPPFEDLFSGEDEDVLPESTSQDGTRKLVLTFTGDVTLGSEEAFRSRSTSFESFDEREGDGYFFANFQEMFENDDLTVINLEGVISDSPAGEVKNKQFRFRGSPTLLNILKTASIEAANISNNHMQDYGNAGYVSTMEELEKAGIGYFGYRDSYIFEKDGLKIGFFGLVSPKITSILPEAKKEMAQMKADGVNAIVFVFHMGTEYGKHRDARQERYAKEVIDAGADLVIMHHPHVLQGMDIYKNRSICYSLGNFCFGGNALVKNNGRDTEKTSEPLRTAVVQAELTFDAGGTYLGQQLTIYPAHISGTFPQSNFQPIRVYGEDAEDVMYVIQRDTKYTLNPYSDKTGSAVQDYLPAK
ncbi:MAG: CapA family protein [Clostridia bacterium]|nr:CapA family protein [Clostridia bacterium]